VPSQGAPPDERSNSLTAAGGLCASCRSAAGVRLRFLYPYREEAVMLRECSRCGRGFSLSDLVKEETKNMEKERRMLGVEGVRFLYFTCANCNHDEIFIDIRALPAESHQEFLKRRTDLEAAVKEVHVRDVEFVIRELL
jgi:hypothetical protein